MFGIGLCFVLKNQFKKSIDNKLLLINLINIYGEMTQLACYCYIKFP